MIPCSTINGAGAARLPNIANVSVEGIEAARTARCAGSLRACRSRPEAPALPERSNPATSLAAMGAPASGGIRFSLGTSTTAADIDRVARNLSRGSVRGDWVDSKRTARGWRQKLERNLRWPRARRPWRDWRIARRPRHSSSPPWRPQKRWARLRTTLDEVDRQLENIGTPMTNTLTHVDVVTKSLEDTAGSLIAHRRSDEKRRFARASQPRRDAQRRYGRFTPLGYGKRLDNLGSIASWVTVMAEDSSPVFLSARLLAPQPPHS